MKNMFSVGIHDNVRRLTLMAETFSLISLGRPDYGPVPSPRPFVSTRPRTSLNCVVVTPGVTLVKQVW